VKSGWQGVNDRDFGWRNEILGGQDESRLMAVSLAWW